MVDVHLIGVVGDLYDVFTTEVAAALELAWGVPGLVLLVGGGHLGEDVGPGAGVGGGKRGGVMGGAPWET